MKNMKPSMSLLGFRMIRSKVNQEISVEDMRTVLRACVDHPDFVKRHILTARQASIVRLARSCSFSAKSLSALLGCSVPSASAQLKGLHHKFYLSRVEKSDPTGGGFYLYRAIDAPEKIND